MSDVVQGDLYLMPVGTFPGGWLQFHSTRTLADGRLGFCWTQIDPDTFRVGLVVALSHLHNQTVLVKQVEVGHRTRYPTLDEITSIQETCFPGDAPVNLRLPTRQERETDPGHCITLWSAGSPTEEQ